MPGTDAQAETFIDRWQKSEGSERGNYQTFLSELCDLLEVPRPDPAVADDADNAYVFDRTVTSHDGKGVPPPASSTSTSATASSWRPSRAARPPRSPSGGGSGECIGWPTVRLKHKGHFPEEKFPVRPQRGFRRREWPRRRRRSHLRDAEWNGCGNKHAFQFGQNLFQFGQT